MTPDLPASNEPQLPTAPAMGFRLPSEMNAPGICRGALTKWPQLHAAIELLCQDPTFRAQLASSGGSLQANLIGSPTQLAALLAANPSCLLQPNPPADIYGWAVWLMMRVYQGARLFHLTLEHLPDIARAAPQANPAAGEAVRDALAGIVSRARDISALANAFGQHLRAAGGNLSMAQADHQAAGEALAKQTAAAAVATGNGTATSMNAHGRVVQAVYDLHQTATQYSATAAKVTAFAVVSNLTSAMDSLSAGWNTTAEQFAGIASGAVVDLGNVEYLRKQQQLDQSVTEWGDFAGMVQNLLKGTLINTMKSF